MMQLFKIRSFGDYFSDTIDFFKSNGKHFFKNYFIINGGFMIVLIAMIYFVVKFYMEAITSNKTESYNHDLNSFDTIFQQNMPLFVGFIVFFFIVIVSLSILNFAFPIVHLKLYQKNNGLDFDTNQIVTELKNNFTKIVVFSIGIIFVYVPIFAIIITICVLLCFVLIGIPILLVAFPLLYSWISIAFYEYLSNNASFFEAFSAGFLAIKNDIWAIAGGTLVMIMIVQVLQTVVTLIPYIIGIIYYFMSVKDFDTTTAQGLNFLSIIIVIVFALSTISGYSANNLLIVTQGMMYYSSREKLENHSSKDLINEIGSDFE